MAPLAHGAPPIDQASPATQQPSILRVGDLRGESPAQTADAEPRTSDFAWPSAPADEPERSLPQIAAADVDVFASIDNEPPIVEAIEIVPFTSEPEAWVQDEEGARPRAAEADDASEASSASASDVAYDAGAWVPAERLDESETPAPSAEHEASEHAVPATVDLSDGPDALMPPVGHAASEPAVSVVLDLSDGPDALMPPAEHVAGEPVVSDLLDRSDGAEVSMPPSEGEASETDVSATSDLSSGPEALTAPADRVARELDAAWSDMNEHEPVLEERAPEVSAAAGATDGGFAIEWSGPSDEVAASEPSSGSNDADHADWSAEAPDESWWPAPPDANAPARAANIPSYPEGVPRSAAMDGLAGLEALVQETQGAERAVMVLEAVARMIRSREIVVSVGAGATAEAVLASILASLLSHPS
ncbi:MAG: hypothetical protein IT361_17920 [Gemmatimonadaceae bacterium]|nr:hypothetical protein [Gemmatimonadaceae bacterium]